MIKKHVMSKEQADCRKYKTKNCMQTELLAEHPINCFEILDVKRVNMNKQNTVTRFECHRKNTILASAVALETSWRLLK